MAKNAIVCGATRGAGRGIARALGEAGYTVICTGRSRPGEPSPYAMPETLDETVAMIPDAVALRVDHADEAQVAALFERVTREHGPIDVVVDSVAGEDPSLGTWTGMIDTDLAGAETALRRGLLPRIYTATHAARTLRTQKRGLLVEVTEYDLLLGAGGNLVASLIKTALKTMATMLAEELHGHGVTAVAVTPGFLRSEVVLRHFQVSADAWRDGIAADPHFAFSESPLFIGRAIAALAADPKVHARTGALLSSWQLSRDYGFTDEDGTRPDWGEHWRTGVVPSIPGMRAGIEHQRDWLRSLAAVADEQLRA
jgi:NAD(P)-dependent dehydrogenase (short-subunit alcohol dehydrogenase family)